MNILNAQPAESEESSKEDVKKEALQVYGEIAGLKDSLNEKAFTNAYAGYYILRKKSKISDSPIVTIIDFTQPASEARMYIVDLSKKSLIIQTHVAHGKNTGNTMAVNFSNRNNSLKSSLGFYSTGERYRGKHKRSMRLHGLESGINSNAFSRAIVLHSASYVSKSWAGRSYGCTSVAIGIHHKIINLTENGTMMYIHHGVT